MESEFQLCLKIWGNINVAVQHHEAMVVHIEAPISSGTWVCAPTDATNSFLVFLTDANDIK
jgi:hypothetical protein